jgi:RHS repeat-associated protein
MKAIVGSSHGSGGHFLEIAGKTSAVSRPEGGSVKRRVSRRLSLVVGCLSFVLAIQVLTVPRTGAQEAEPTAEPSAEVSDTPPGEPIIPIPLTDADRVPVPVPVDFNGVVDPLSVDLTPVDADDETSLASIIGDEIKMPAEGGPDFDIYAPGDGVGTHFAVLYPTIVNEQDDKGDWVPIDVTPQPVPDGWSVETNATRVFLPETLAPATPVSFETAGGSISAAPSGALGSKGLLEGIEIRYPTVLPATDFVYLPLTTGYKESVILQDATAPTKFSWDLEAKGFALSKADDGRIEILVGDQVVAEMAPAIVLDSSDPPSETSADYTLTDLGSGSHTISIELDAAWLATAKYPVTIDPGLVTPNLLNDTFVRSNQPSNSFGTSVNLYTGPWTGGGTKQRGFLRFGTAWEQPNRVVWSAILHIFNNSEAAPVSDPVEIKRVTWDWNNAMTWNSMIAQPNEGISDTPGTPNGDGAQGAEWTIQLKKLYQTYSDGTYPDYGFQLRSNSEKIFYSSDAAGTATDPYLLVSYNTIPNGPVATVPAPGKVFDSRGGVTLKIDHLPNDADGDDVLVRYQVTNTQGQWTCGGSGKNCSAWTDEESFDVPASWLTDGGTYWWRAQSADVCTQPDTLCDNTKPDGTLLDWKNSGESDFTISLKNWGTDDTYQMWSQDIGNGVGLNVNEANGNMYLRMKLDSLPTPLGHIGIGLSYNSQSAVEGNDIGLGDGWRLYAGPESSSERLPTELQELSPVPWGGVKIKFRSGRAETFPWRSLRTYAGVGSGSGVVRKNPNGTFIYRGPDGDVFTFNADGTLKKAKPVFTKDKAALANANYRYTYDAQSHLITVTDPLDRDITFDWTLVSGIKRLTGIHVWGGHDWVITYSGGAAGRVATVQNPANETVQFLYGTFASATLISEVRNGFQYQQAGQGWQLNYFQDAAPAGTTFDLHRVNRIIPPWGFYAGTGSSTYWRFDYGTIGADYIGSTSLSTEITDPRGTWTTSSSTDYQTIAEFNDAGLPIRITAPKLAGETTNYITTMVWDSNNNLVCSRSPAANAVLQACLASRNDNDTNNLNTSYGYETDEPFRLLQVTEPAASAAGGGRRQTTYAYDDGGSFQGLWAELFENEDLSGVPDDEGLWPDLNQNWGTGHPGGIQVTNNFSVRLSGNLLITQTKRYEFQVTGDDGYTLVVGNTVLLDCLSVTTPAVNCGLNNPPATTLWPGDRPITIEYKEITGNANLKVEWREKGTSNWSVIPASVLAPNLGLLTTKVTGPQGGGNDLKLEKRWTYGGDVRKMTRLPNSKVMTDLLSLVSRTTDFEYDDFGRKTKITKFSGSGASYEAVTQKFYTDDATAKTSCLTKIIGPEGEKTEFTCNKWGDVLTTTVTLRDVTVGGTQLQAPDTRVTTNTYDAMGRVIQTDIPNSGSMKTTYDKSGRITQSQVLIRGTGASTEDWSTTTFAYVDWPAPGFSRTITETGPDPDNPDNATSTTGPVVMHTINAVGDETLRTDPRTGLGWGTVYDAQNRVVQSSTPDPDGGGSLTPLTTTTSYSLTSTEYSTTVTDPAGVASKTWFDCLGRRIEERVGTLAPTWFVYDQVSNVTKVQTSDTAPGTGGTIYSWRGNTYDAFDKALTATEPAVINGGAPTTVTTTYTYFTQTGRLKQVNGPLTDDASHKDVLDYTYDLSGRTKTVELWTKGGASPENFTTTLYYNDSGETLRIAADLSADGSRVQRRDFTYTGRGLLKTTTEHHGTGAGQMGDVVTTNSYDVGGRLQSLDSPRWSDTNELKFAYDDLGREVSRYRLSGTNHVDEITTTYNADGSINTLARAGGPTYAYTYDGVNRLTSFGGGNGTTTWNHKATGQLDQLITTAGTTSYAYNINGLLGSQSDPVTGGATAYTYDAAGRPITRTDVGGLTWNRSYEQETGRVDTQRIWKTGTNPQRTFAYADLGYDEAGDVTSRMEKLWKLGTTSSPATTAGDTGTGTWTYGYDGAERMTSATGIKAIGGTWSGAYTYDGLGDRLSSVENGVTLNYTTDDQGWPTSVENPGTGTTPDATYTHNGDGGLESLDDRVDNSKDRSFVYDAWGSTDLATAGTATVDYALDALGRTTTRTVGASLTHSYYIGGSEDLAQTQAGSTITKFAYTPNGPLATKVGAGTASLYLRDIHGDVVGTLASGASSLTDELWYSPYGESQTIGAGSLPALGYQGDWTDPSTNAVDMLTRFYMPSMGRFSTRDVLSGDPTGPPSLNQFVYGEGSPITYVDPTGMGCQDAPSDGLCTQPDPDTWEKDSGGTGTSPGNSIEPNTLQDFEGMTARERVAWLQQFELETHSGGWFAAIAAVISKWDSIGAIRPGSYSSYVDAYILFAIQQGYLKYSAGPGAMQANMARGLAVNWGTGANEWVKFFAALHSSQTPTDHELGMLWARGELAATHSGDTYARLMGADPSGQEAAFLDVTDGYRHDLMAGSTNILPNNYATSRIAVDYAWAIAGLKSFQLADVFDPFHLFREAELYWDPRTM